VIYAHAPVLRDDALNYLLTDPTRVYVDATVGGGGHAEAICERLRENGRLICFDADADAITVARERLQHFGDRVLLVHSNFRNLRGELRFLGINVIQGLLLDLGVSSFQLDEAEKGFSFRIDARLDMRMDRKQLLSGWHVVNEYDEHALSAVLWKYGEERHARRIAKRIARARPVDTTSALGEIVAAVVGKKFLTKSLARVFQAIRIEVNDELKNLEQVLHDSVSILSPGGRLVVISYHSLEDRAVKTMFRREAITSIPSGHKYLPDETVIPRLKILTRKPVVPSLSEIARNPRARSAKIRVAERIPPL
jgi:16S rRNA (cytosine1402-N4)-methyltransferase